jgi:hypothetical protein
VTSKVRAAKKQRNAEAAELLAAKAARREREKHLPAGPPPERRSTMTAKRKSDLINAIGLDKYNSIPW